MIQDLKALIVVLTLGSLAFVFAKKIWLTAMTPEDFKLRRNLWWFLTAWAFLSPSFWTFVVVALPVLLWAGRKDSNPLALYVVLLHVIPPFAFNIPMVGVNHLFPLDNYRLLALTLLLPLALNLLSSQDVSSNRNSRKIAYSLLVVFLLFQVGQLAPSDSLTNSVRRLFLGFIDCILLVYVFSRYIKSYAQIRDVLVSYAMILAVMAPIAAFETARGWLVYQEIAAGWNAPISFVYLMRGDFLRAQVSTGHALAFGYMGAIAFGIWLYIYKTKQDGKLTTWLLGAWLWMGLVASFSRAPWLTCILMIFVFTLITPGTKGRWIKLVGYSSIALAALLILPIGDRIINLLPFVGTVDVSNVTYRQRLAEESWKVIQMFPIFGNPNALQFLEHMRQGEGIVDLVNVYASIALFHGFFGFTLFFGYFLMAFSSAVSSFRLNRVRNVQAAQMGACLVTLLLGTHFFMATGSFGTGLEKMSWVLSALALGYAGIREKAPAS